jgi:hypothetical protein
MATDRVEAIQGLLEKAAEAHHVYERDELGGTFDEAWPAWYGAWIAQHGLGAIVGREVPRDQAVDLLTRAWAELQALDPKPPESWAAWTAKRVATELLPG